MTPTPAEVAVAISWLTMRGGAFYPTAAIHASVITRHIQSLTEQVENLTRRIDLQTQGDDFSGGHT